MNRRDLFRRLIGAFGVIVGRPTLTTLGTATGPFVVPVPLPYTLTNTDIGISMRFLSRYVVNPDPMPERFDAYLALPYLTTPPTGSFLQYLDREKELA